MAFEKNRANTKDNPNPVLEYLRNSNADIICLQEYIVGGRLTKKEVDYALRDYPYKIIIRYRGQRFGLLFPFSYFVGTSGEICQP